MKFEKFIKRAGINAVIVSDHNGTKWIYNDGVAMPIPEVVVNNYGDATAMLPRNVIDGLRDINPEEGYFAELVRAEIPADGKTKEITRIYADNDFEFKIRNADWALIERSDIVDIVIDNNDEPVAIAVHNGRNVIGIIFPIGFTRNDLEKLEDDHNGN